MDQICELLGLKRSTLYGHLSILKARVACSWRAVESKTIIISFACADAPQSRNLDKPYLSSDSNKDLESQIKNPPKKRRAVQKSGQSRNLDKPPALSTMRQITDAYCELLGFKPDDWSQGEGSAAKSIGQTYTVEQFREVYRHLKSQTFWRSKRLWLRQIKGEMGEYFAAKADGRLDALKSKPGPRLPDGV
jgi:hypothetical protein